ncbi:hypothetical protein D3C81_676700 [compost metagenome]
MNRVKSIAIGSLLLGLMGSAYAESGYERAQQFTQNFRAEQARLWNDQTSDKQNQQVAQQARQAREEKADN